MNFKPIAPLNYSSIWLIVVVFLMVLLVTLIKFYHSKRFSLYLRAFLEKRILKQISREENGLSHPLMLGMFIHAVIAIALMTFLVLFTNILTGEEIIVLANRTWLNEFGVFLGLVLCFVLVYFGKVFFHSLLKKILHIDGIVEEYIAVVIFSVNMLGLVLLPILVFTLFFSKNIAVYGLITALIFTLISFIYRLYNGVSGAISRGIFKPYIFLYLCTLEILPFLIVGALIKG